MKVADLEPIESPTLDQILEHETAFGFRYLDFAVAGRNWAIVRDKPPGNGIVYGKETGSIYVTGVFSETKGWLPPSPDYTSMRAHNGEELAKTVLVFDYQFRCPFPTQMFMEGANSLDEDGKGLAKLLSAVDQSRREKIARINQAMNPPEQRQALAALQTAGKFLGKNPRSYSTPFKIEQIPWMVEGDTHNVIPNMPQGISVVYGTETGEIHPASALSDSAQKPAHAERLAKTTLVFDPQFQCPFPAPIIIEGDTAITDDDIGGLRKLLDFTAKHRERKIAAINQAMSSSEQKEAFAALQTAKRFLGKE